MVGGTGFFSGGISGGANTSFYGTATLQPRIGIFIADRLVAGTGIGLSYASIGADAQGGRNFYSGSIQPYLRYYFTKQSRAGELPKGLVPFAELGGGVSGTIYRSDRWTGASGYGAIGFNKFLNEHVALEVSLSYTRQSFSTIDAGYRSNGLGGGVGLQIFLGRKKPKQPKGTDAVR